MSPGNVVLQAKEAFDNAFWGAIFNEDATYSDLIKLVMILAFMVFVTFELLRPLLTALIKGPWISRFLRIADIEYNRPDIIEQVNKVYGVTTKEEYLELLFKFWPDPILILSQHLIGGILAIPSVFCLSGYTTSVASSLACLGILLEMGWEVQDFAKQLYSLFYKGIKDEGQKKNAIQVLIFSTFHHSLTCLLALPMIISYRNLPELHRLCFNLQGAGCLAGLLLEFGTRTLDVTKKEELIMFVIYSYVLLLVFAWTRCLDWFYPMYKVLALFYREKRWVYLAVGCLGGLTMTLVNMLFLHGCIDRIIKFSKKLKAYNELPQDVDDATRESVSHELRASSGEVLTTMGEIPEEGFTNLFLQMGFEDRQVERRHTVTVAELSRSVAQRRSIACLSMRQHRHTLFDLRDLPNIKED